MTFLFWQIPHGELVSDASDSSDPAPCEVDCYTTGTSAAILITTQEVTVSSGWLPRMAGGSGPVKKEV